MTVPSLGKREDANVLTAKVNANVGSFDDYKTFQDRVQDLLKEIFGDSWVLTSELHSINTEEGTLEQVAGRMDG